MLSIIIHENYCTNNKPYETSLIYMNCVYVFKRPGKVLGCAERGICVYGTIFYVRLCSMCVTLL